METLKPDNLIEQSLTAFFQDVGNQFQISRKDLHRNIEYVVRRYRCEGLGFVTKTLPKLGKAFDASLRDGRIHPCPVKTGRGSLPLCLTGLINLVFEKDGALKDRPNVEAVSAIRQLCFMYYKLEGNYPQEIVDACIEKFQSTDQSLDQCDEISPDKTSILYEASRIIGKIFSGLDVEEIIPRPGPGQTADKCPSEHRYEPHVWYKTLHEAYPYYRYFYCGSSHLLDSVRRYRSLPRQQHGTSVLTVVPKDSRGPRIICMEPSEYMWLQQGLGRMMMEHMERHPLTRGHVNFTDQTINGRLALNASHSGLLATLDMKEASDRISRSLVDYLFQEVPALRQKLLALSTRYIELPSGDILETRKFAPMGSALCFPVMSVVHYALALSCLKHTRPGENFKALAKHLYVYGDDIICHTEDAQILFDEFPVYGLVFNQDKSFTKGKFRESCGVDAYDGIDVSPQRIKSIRFRSKDGASLQKQLAYYHGLKTRGYARLALLWRVRIEETWGDLPYVTQGSGVPGWVVPQSLLKVMNHGLKYDCRTQTLRKRVRIVTTRKHASMLGSWERFLRSQVHCVVGNSSSLVRRHQCKMRWVSKPLSSL